MEINIVHGKSCFVHSMSRVKVASYVVDYEYLSIVSIETIVKIKEIAKKNEEPGDGTKKPEIFLLSDKSTMDTMDTMDSINTQWLKKIFSMDTTMDTNPFAMDRG